MLHMSLLKSQSQVTHTQHSGARYQGAKTNYNLELIKSNVLKHEGQMKHTSKQQRAPCVASRLRWTVDDTSAKNRSEATVLRSRQHTAESEHKNTSCQMRPLS